MFQTKSLENLDFENSNLFRISIFGFRIFQLQTLFGFAYAGLGFSSAIRNPNSELLS